MNTPNIDLDSVLAEVVGDPLTIPYRGETYVCPPAKAALGIEIEAKFAEAIRAAKNDDEVTLDDAIESDLYAKLWGPEWDRIVANGVPWAAAKLMGSTAMIDARFGREAAMLYLSHGGKAPKAARQPQDRHRKNGKRKRTGSKPN